ncbi:hypothetical protein ['Camptotheca acuminata' phytoplasma]|uniref:hypothetical protein n=1 Tax='Camptotheca acuminata' phytoplasma TaxID=3239192 RepID=UPI00351A9585
MNSSLSWFVVVFLISTIIVFFMNFVYNSRENNKIINYLTQISRISSFEQELFKSILKEYKENKFTLTKKHTITKKWIDLKIVIKLEENKNNPLQFVCYLNKKVFRLIQKNNKLKQLYL